MKKIFISTAIGCLLFSCQKEAVTNSSKQPSALSSTTTLSTVGAIPFNDQTFIDLATSGMPVTNACTGESLEFIGGTLHIDLHGVVNTNSTSFTFTASGQGLVIEAPDGTIYRGGGTQKFQETDNLTNGSVIVNETGHFEFTSSGSGNIATITANFHLTINANGTTVVTVDNFTLRCK
jgi:hypothetical protein